MWKLLKLTLLAAAVESGGSATSGEPLRMRGESVALVDAAYGPPPLYALLPDVPPRPTQRLRATRSATTSFTEQTDRTTHS
jgi:hypothetical protein